MDDACHALFADPKQNKIHRGAFLCAYSTVMIELLGSRHVAKNTAQFLLFYLKLSTKHRMQNKYEMLEGSVLFTIQIITVEGFAYASYIFRNMLILCSHADLHRNKAQRSRGCLFVDTEKIPILDREDSLRLVFRQLDTNQFASSISIPENAHSLILQCQLYFPF